MSFITYGTTTIHYYHHKQARKDIKISVDLVNGVEVYTPEKIDEDKLAEIIKKKASWITNKLQELDEVQTSVQPIEFISGEKLPYLGRHYRLKVYKEAIPNASFKFKQGRFIATIPRNWSQEQVHQKLEEKLIAWYRQHGLNKIIERASIYQSMLGVEPRSLQLKAQHKRWGTCTPNGDIYLNWRIVMAPIRVIDYVIVHELAHLIIPKHNDEFWRMVGMTLLHYKEAKEWLRVHGVELHSIGYYVNPAPFHLIQ
ncbi:SprT family zinc-dependent metalloprotease [Aciduricibacillus chroicocephali]|uniref:SprT family zinc-dependent metalloprotease n=1 Tax=Aciduricibacillus chroicocephali TaxID=3054939 RepID=A0ABY9KUX0_9BACI|nr:SprT family zinc-dependent metalloprotease [Bacillaceae bacterium 44XB]